MIDTNSKHHVEYICWGCAGLYGGEAGDTAFTAHEDQCENCGSRTSLALVDDWNWPNGKPAKWRGAGRD